MRGNGESLAGLKMLTEKALWFAPQKPHTQLQDNIEACIQYRVIIFFPQISFSDGGQLVYWSGSS